MIHARLSTRSARAICGKMFRLILTEPSVMSEGEHTSSTLFRRMFSSCPPRGNGLRTKVEKSRENAQRVRL